MTEQSNAVVTTQPQPKSSVATVREKSSAELTKAIHSPASEDWIMERARKCIETMPGRDLDGPAILHLVQSFARALSSYPQWAVAKAFNGWEAKEEWRPTPGKIADRAAAAVRPLTEELAARERAAEREADGDAEKPRFRSEEEKGRAKMILDRAGFTPKRAEALRRRPDAATMEEAESPDAPEPHWSERYAEDSEEWRQIRAARDANPLVREAREAQARHAAQRAAEAAEASQEDESDV